MTSSQPPPTTHILPPPPSRHHNNSAADVHTSTSLIAYAAASSISIVDSSTMQLISVHPIPPPQTSSLSPYITSVRWSPSSLRLDPLSHDPTSSHSHLLLAAGI
ncbi:hypothetical protein Tco_1040309 [Tanacetum coccineum]